MKKYIKKGKEDFYKDLNKGNLRFRSFVLRKLEEFTNKRLEAKKKLEEAKKEWDSGVELEISLEEKRKKKK